MLLALFTTTSLCSMHTPCQITTSFHRLRGGGKHPGDKGTWSGEASRNRGYGFTENEVTINIGDNEAVETSQAPVKERPVWLTESTVEMPTGSAFGQQQVCRYEFLYIIFF